MENLHIINLAQYNRPEITEDKYKDWVNYGTNNDYYQYLIDRYSGSATNNAIINGVTNMIYGKGLDASNSNKKPNEYAQMKSIFSNEDVRRTVFDLKLLGEGSMQILYKNGKVHKAEHFPRQTLRPEKCNEEGKIEAYYYYHDWTKLKPSDKPKRIPAFGCGNGKESEIKIIKRYVSGFDYVVPVDYQGGLAYAELEEEIADYLINEVQCGFSGTKVVNFNNGVPDREKQMEVKSDILGKLTGSRGEKVIVAFNNNAESKTTIDDVPLNDAPQHYEYLSNECVKKLIIAHRVTSPLLIGVKDNNGGLGNNADEIKTANLLFDNIVIKNYQGLLIDCFDSILAVNGISLNLYFKTLQPLELIEIDQDVDKETKEEETGVKLSKQDQDTLDNKVFDCIKESGEDEDLEGWTLIDSQPAGEDESKIHNLLTFATVIKSSPNKKSKEQDTELFRIRYQYAPLKTSPNSREFCKKMVSAKKVYRYEDLQGELTNNAGFGPDGTESYSIWLYKGGPNCKHAWERKIYLKKNNKKISVGQARRIITSLPVDDRKDARYDTNPKEVATIPFQMPNRGYKNPQ